MAVVKFSELHQERRSTEDITSDPPEIKRFRGFLVFTDDKTDTETTVLAAADPIGAYHPTDPNSRLLRRGALPIDDSPKFWRVQYEYSTNWLDLEQDTDPLLFQTKVEEFSRSIELPHFFDAVTGEPLLNAAGDPPDPPLPFELTVSSFTVEKNFATRPNFIRGLKNTTNNADLLFLGVTYPANTFRMSGYRISRQKFHKRFGYFTAIVEFETDPLGFNSTFLNAGLNHLFAGLADGKETIMIKGEPATQPQPLYADGSLIPTDQLPAAANALSFSKYTPADYSQYGLPT